MATYIPLAHDLDDVVDELSSGANRVGIDTERAQGYAYGDDAYLVQIKREGGKTFLVDSAGNRDLSAINDVLGQCVWIIHSADQDLVCLERLNMVPGKLFDTEVAAELAGCEHIGLAGLVKDFMDIDLPKVHQAEDWSKRPLPDEWLDYAAHDVEYLHELMDVLTERLEGLGRLEWVEEECEHGRLHPAGVEPKKDPWKRLKGMRDVKDVKGRAIVYALWTYREEIAKDLNLAPHRVLPNAALVWAGKNHISSFKRFRSWRHRGVRTFADEWKKALAYSRTLGAKDLKSEPSGESKLFPPVYVWKKDDPKRFSTLHELNDVQHVLEAQLHVPMYRILSADNRMLVAWLWEKPGDVRGLLEAQSDARAWQIDLVEPYFEAILAGDDIPKIDEVAVPPTGEVR